MLMALTCEVRYKVLQTSTDGTLISNQSTFINNVMNYINVRPKADE